MVLPEDVRVGRDAAYALRLSEDLGLGPITDLWTLIRRLDVDLAFHGFGSEGPEGVYFWDGKRGLIVVNLDREPSAKQRFTAAHELGHHLIHREAGQPRTIAEGDFEAGAPDKPSEERQADAFAGYLLAPNEAMRAAFPEKNASDMFPEDVAELMHEFGTTFVTTVYRLHNSNRISSTDRDRLLREGQGRVRHIQAAKGYDQVRLPPEPLPPNYQADVTMLFVTGAIDEDQLRGLLRFSSEKLAAYIEIIGAAQDEISAEMGSVEETSDFALAEELLRE